MCIRDSDHTLAVVLAAAIGIEGKLSIQQSAELMRSALEGSADSIVLLGHGFRPVWANSAALRLFDMESGELSQLDFRKIIPDIDWDAKGWLHGGSFSDDVRVKTRDGVVRCSAAITHAHTLGSRTVSYTHLDVYKRQAISYAPAYAMGNILLTILGPVVIFLMA